MGRTCQKQIQQPVYQAVYQTLAQTGLNAVTRSTDSCSEATCSYVCAATTMAASMRKARMLSAERHHSCCEQDCSVAGLSNHEVTAVADGNAQCNFQHPAIKHPGHAFVILNQVNACSYNFITLDDALCASVVISAMSTRCTKNKQQRLHRQLLGNEWEFAAADVSCTSTEVSLISWAHEPAASPGIAQVCRGPLPGTSSGRTVPGFVS